MNWVCSRDKKITLLKICLNSLNAKSLFSLLVLSSLNHINCSIRLMVLEDGSVVPSMICSHQVKTTRELFDEFSAQGFRVNYARIPISPEQRPEDKYLQEYLKIVQKTSKHDSLVFNCGMGVGRSKCLLKVNLCICILFHILYSSCDRLCILISA
jgi:hypothetical protein